MVEEGVEADSSAAMSHCYWYCAATQAANRKRLAVRAAAEKSKRKQGEKFLLVRSRGNGRCSAKLLKQFNFGTAHGRSLYPDFVLFDTDQLRLLCSLIHYHALPCVIMPFTAPIVATPLMREQNLLRPRCNLRFAQE